MGERALRTHCSSPPVSTMNKTACSARSLLRTASTATKSSVYVSCFSEKQSTWREIRRQSQVTLCRLFYFSTSKQESLHSVVHFSVLFSVRRFFPFI